MPAKRATLPPEIKKLVQEVIAPLDEVSLSEDSKQLAKEDPEACLIGLLKQIRDDLKVTGATLKFTVDMATAEVVEANWQAEHQAS
jgi:hypothetical protein